MLDIIHSYFAPQSENKFQALPAIRIKEFTSIVTRWIINIDTIGIALENFPMLKAESTTNSMNILDLFISSSFLIDTSTMRVQ